MSEINPASGAGEDESISIRPEGGARAREGGPDGPHGLESLENYFNYFTEIEECYQKCRGTPTMLSPLDWALIESWKEAGVPLEAALNGIERAFAKFARRPHPFRKVNGLGYCVQTVMQAAEELAAALREGGARPADMEKRQIEPGFTPDQIADFLERNADVLEKSSGRWRAAGQTEMAAVAADLAEAAAAVRAGIPLAPEAASDGRELENTLSAVEDKLTASVTRAATLEQLTTIRQEFERSLAPHRQRMSALQLELLERQFLKKRLYEHFGIPRLSLFYCL